MIGKRLYYPSLASTLKYLSLLVSKHDAADCIVFRDLLMAIVRKYPVQWPHNGLSLIPILCGKGTLWPRFRCLELLGSIPCVSVALCRRFWCLELLGSIPCVMWGCVEGSDASNCWALSLVFLCDALSKVLMPYALDSPVERPRYWRRNPSRRPFNSLLGENILLYCILKLVMSLFGICSNY